MRRLIILLTAAGALLIAPAAHAGTGVEPVEVLITGSGAGKVIDAPGGTYTGDPEINCTYAFFGPPTGTCKTFMSDEGEGWEQVFLEAVPAPGSRFSGWKVKNAEFEGCVGTLTVCAPYVEPPGTGSGGAHITATFDHVDFATSLIALVTGDGTVVSNPAGISCGATCKAEFEEGKTVTLTASPGLDWAFLAWSGCLEHVGLTCKVLIDKDKTVKVTFIATPSLTVEKAGSGAGKIAATGISCDESCSKESAAVKTGTAVTVKTTPAKGSQAAVFEGGTGSASGCSGGTCTFTSKPTAPSKSGCTTETETFFATGRNRTRRGTPCKLLTDVNKTVEAEFK